MIDLDRTGNPGNISEIFVQHITTGSSFRSSYQMVNIDQLTSELLR